MSAATMSGADAVKGVNASSSKQSLKSTTSGKALDTARKQAASPPTEGQNRKSQPPQPKAWTGTNPITQRAPPVIPNGTEKSTSRPTSQSLSKTVAETNGDKHAHDRALFLLASFTGNDATITLRNGEQFTGIFSGGSFDSASKHQYILKMVKRTRPPTAHTLVNGASTELLGESEYIGEGEDHMMVFDKEDTVDLSVPDVAPLTAQPLQNGSISTSFRTDTEISGRDPSMPRERELQRWDGGGDTALGLSLEDSGTTGWDQFAANEAMYGVSTTYDENIYTTQIDRSDPRYKNLEANAARIAREIEGTAPATAHVAEERLQNAPRVDGGMDEEEKYSGVRRDATPASLPKRATGAYVPPSQRPITNAPTVPGAPFDPAIISSTVARPTAATERAVKQPKPADVAATEQLKTPPSEAAAKDSKSAGPATTQQTPVKKSENTTEDHVRGVADHFKQFANNEKLRIRIVQEQKRTAQRAEKNVKLNDLKKFAANFKLNSRIPDDLVPILAKDHEKQQEIQRKADEAYKEKEKRAKEKDAEKASVGAASPAPSAASSIAGTAAGVATAQAGKVEPPHVPFNRNARMSGTTRPPQPIPPIHMQSPNRNVGGATNRAYANIPGFPPRPQPFPTDIKIPTAPSHPAVPGDLGPLSPGAATRLNAGAKAFEFRPGAHAFTPTGTTPSPHRLDPEPETAEFFAKDKSADSTVTDEETNDYDNTFRGVTQVPEEPTDDSKPQFTTTGGVPQPYRTAPTWGSESQKDFISFTDLMPKAPTPNQTHSQVHTPNPNTGQMPHQHQLPPHMQQQAGTPNQRPPYIPPHHFPPNMPPHHPGQFGPGMHGFGGNGSVQSSPRFSGAQVAFNGQIPQGMGMPQFAGQQFNGQQVGHMGMQGYGMSPQMGYRQVQMPGMPPGGPGGMMMMPGGQGQHGQMAMNQGYPRNPQQYNPNMMQGGVPMQNQASSSGYPMPAPLPGQPGQSYSPMPPHVTPHMPHQHPHNQHIQQSPYTGSPRPAHMMQHATSHQGFNPGAGGPMGPYAPSPGMGQNYPHPYALQHRQMSTGAYAAMTPRQAPAMPMQPSPGMGGAGTGAHGDEGK